MRRRLIKYSLIPILLSLSTIIYADHTNEASNQNYKILMGISHNCKGNLLSNKIVFNAETTPFSSIQYADPLQENNIQTYNNNKGLEMFFYQLFNYISQKNEPRLLIAINIKKGYKKGQNKLTIGEMMLTGNEKIGTKPTSSNSAIFSLESHPNEPNFQLVALQHDNNLDDGIYDLSGLYCKLTQKNNNFIFNCSCVYKK